MGVCPENEPDLVNRDPNNINAHIKVSSLSLPVILTARMHIKVWVIHSYPGNEPLVKISLFLSFFLFIYFSAPTS